MIAILIISAIVFVIYVSMILAFSNGIYKLKKKLPGVTSCACVSIIIPFKNEEKMLSDLIKSLFTMNHKCFRVELIFVDDYSTDKSAEIIQQITDIPENFNIQLIKTNKDGKKHSQYCGVLESSHDILLFTDADCRVSENWLTSMCSLLNNEIKMVCGPVVMTKNHAFDFFFRTEFASLVLSGAGAFGIKRPIFCNGANILVRKQAYLDVWNSQSGKLSVSGDDVFLLHAIIKQFSNNSIVFSFNTDSTVFTDPPNNLPDFLRQRQRWASKARFYKNTFTIFTSICVFIMSASIILLAVLPFPQTLMACCIGLCLKTLADSMLFYSGKQLQGNKYLFLWSVPLQFIYPIYVIISAISSVLYRNAWKK